MSIYLFHNDCGPSISSILRTTIQSGGRIYFVQPQFNNQFCLKRARDERHLMDIRQLVSLPSQELAQHINRIGNTPMVLVKLLVAGRERLVYLKLEGCNPTGSMKDRTGYSLMQSLKTQGVLHEGDSVIESTSGNLGVTLAFLCKAKKYHFIAVIDPKVTRENVEKMLAFGATIEMVDTLDKNGGYLLSRIKHVQELCERADNYVWTNQYVNPANPLIHYHQTAVEIYLQMDKQVDAVFVPVSTGGTLAGIGRYFRERSPTTRIIGVDAYGSVIFGTPPGSRRLTGIGSSRPSAFISEKLYDTFMLVHDDEAFSCCHKLYIRTNLRVGGSSGASIYACATYLAAHPEIERVVCVCPDDGANYLSSIFNDAWLQLHHVDASSSDKVGVIQDIQLAVFAPYL